MSASGLDDYLHRIGAHGQVQADLETLVALHCAHVETIPFENLDIQMGRGVTLDAGALQAKMVGRRRGGYCFEQNTLFAMALQSIGFAVATREARVRQNSGGVLRPRTHMALIVACEGREWLADVGFGGDGLVEPVALDGVTSQQCGFDYRVDAQGREAVLQRRVGGAWDDLYAVQPEPVSPVDFEMANWYTSTYPRSPFVLNVTAQRVIDGTRHILRNLKYTIARGTDVQVREITRAELVPLLAGPFGIDVPEDSTFKALDAAPA